MPGKSNPVAGVRPVHNRNVYRIAVSREG